ncbi:MAG: ABC transporter permease [Acidobacteriaceae bacterium]
MRKLKALWIRIFGMFAAQRASENIDAELDSHLQLHIDDNLRAGMTLTEARRQALIQLGGLEQTKQAVRERSSVPWLENLAQDLKFALRQLRKSPGFTLAATILLGLGIGAATIVFSLINAVLLKPLPYSDPSTLVIPWNIPPAGVNIGGFTDFPWSPDHFHAMEQETKTYRFLGAFQSADFNLTEAGDPAMLEGAQVSWGFFPALGVQPELGRFFTRDEDTPGREHEVILSDALWRSRFHADPSILNHAIHLNGMPWTVIGIMPRGFGFPRANEMPADFDFPRETELWVPIALPAVTPRFTPSELAFIGRLQPGVSVQQAQAAMDLFAANMDRLHPTWKGWSRSHVTPLQRQVAGDTRKPLLLILGAVGVVLLIVCFNIAGLQMARSLGRRREVTVRVAMGATRRRVVRQLLTENLLLAAAGGALAAAIVAAGMSLVRKFGPANLPRLHEAGADPGVFAFACCVTLLTGILFGLAPALGAARVDLVESLRDGGQKAGTASSRPRLRNALVVAQMSLALVLVVAAGLLVRTFHQLLTSDSGFHAEHVLTFELSLPATQYPDRDRIARFYQQLLPRLRAVPGIKDAAAGEVVPMGSATESTMIRLIGRPAPKDGRNPIVNYTVASPGYFAALGTPLLRGRDLLDSDLLNAPPVTIVNRALAQAYWPGQNPIGQQVLVPSQQIPATIVGVVANMKHTSLREGPEPEMFEPFTQNVWPSLAQMQVVLRTQASPESAIAGARDAIHSLDPGLPLAKIATLTALTDEALEQDRFSMLLLSFFGALALILAAIGIYGAVAYSVGQQTREIGIRMALGARRGDVFSSVLSHSLRVALPGVALGVCAALGVGRAMAGYLYGVTPYDPATFAAVSMFLIATAVLAGFFPARRAATVNPMQALRSE